MWSSGLQILLEIPADPSERAAYLCGASIPTILFAVGAIKLSTMIGKRRTNVKGILSLLILLLAMVISVPGNFGLELLKSSEQVMLWRLAAIGLGLFVLVAMLASITLAIIALVEISKRPLDYERGRGQAISALVISVLMLGGSAIGIVVKIVQRNAVPGATYASTQTPAGQPIAFEEFGFSFDAPDWPWVRTDAKRIQKDSCLAFSRGSPQMFFLIIGESTTAVPMSTETLAEAAIINMRTASPECEPAYQRDEKIVDGHPGIRMYSRAKIGRHDLTYVHWVCSVDGRAVQLITSGNRSDEAEVQAAAERMLPRFHFDPKWKPPVLAGSAPPANASGMGPMNSPFGYSVQLSEGGWREWTNYANDFPDAEFAAMRPDNTFVTVTPIALLGKTPTPRQLTESFLGRFGFRFVMSRTCKP